MPFTATDILLGFGVPVLVAAVLAWLIVRLAPADVGGRYAAPVALAAGTAAGFWLLKLGPAAPESHWHWLPWCVLAGAATGPVGRASGATLLDRLLLFGLVATISMWWLVPDWEELDPAREMQLAAGAGVVTLSALALDALTARLTGPLLPLTLVINLGCGAAVLALSGSLRFAQIVGAGVGALCGLSLFALFDRSRLALLGGALPYAVLAGGAMLVGRVNSYSEVPLASYLLIPLAPAAAWVCVAEPPAGPSRLRRWLGLMVIVALSALAAALAYQAEGAGYEELQ